MRPVTDLSDFQAIAISQPRFISHRRGCRTAGESATLMFKESEPFRSKSGKIG